MDFNALIEKAIVVRKKYVELEKKQYGREWSGEELMLGFMKDVGDLAKLVQAKEGIRDIEDINNKFAHELSDCLWSVIVIANKYNVDIGSAFNKTMQELEDHLENS